MALAHALSTAKIRVTLVVLAMLVVSAPAAAAQASGEEVQVAEVAAPAGGPVSTGSPVLLLAHVAEDGQICQRLQFEAPKGNVDLGCQPSPTEPGLQPTGFALANGSTFEVGLVVPQTASVQLGSGPLVTAAAGPSPTARHVLAVRALGTAGTPVVTQDAEGRFLSVGPEESPFVVLSGETQDVPVGGPRQARAKVTALLDRQASLARSRLVRGPALCLGYYVYRAPSSSTQCFKLNNSLAGPTVCNDAQGRVVVGVGPARARSIDVRSLQGRLLARKATTAVKTPTGTRQVFVIALRNRGSAADSNVRLRVILRDRRGRQVITRRTTYTPTTAAAASAPGLISDDRVPTNPGGCQQSIRTPPAP